MNTPIYKICDAAEWEAARASGRYTGSGDDIRDGFIHFSTAGQLAETAAKHFAGRENLLLVAVDPASLGDALKWEPSRNGALFPHLYGPLDMGAVLSVDPLRLGADGVLQIPEGNAR